MKNINKIKNLIKLKNKLEIELNKKKKEKTKQFHIKNLKIFSNTCNFLLPFVISAGITVSGIAFFDGGLPFHKDEEKKH